MPLIEKQRSDIWAGFALQELNIGNGVFLNTLRDLPGVPQGFICDETGEMLGAWVTGDWDKVRAIETGVQIAQALGAWQASGKKPRELEIRFERGGIFVRVIGHAFAFVMCAPSVDWAMLRMSLNVAAPTYETNTAVQNALQAASKRRAQGVDTAGNALSSGNAWARFP